MDLVVQKREKLGKAVKALRRGGLIPAELYGRGKENLHLSIPVRDFLKVYKEAGTNTIVNLLLENGPSTSSTGSTGSPQTSSGHKSSESARVQVLIYDVGRNYLTGAIDHVDFYAVRMDEKIKAKIPIEFLGVAPAVKDKGGILTKSMSEVEVEALPGDLPHKFEVDISVLDDLNKSIYVKDIKAAKGVKVLVDPETPIVTVAPPALEEEEKKVEEPVDVTAVKVETEEKKAEREAGKATKEGEKKGQGAE